MNTANILQINSSGRYEGSITRQVSKRVVNFLKKNNPTLKQVSRDVASGLPFIDEAWINANFTAPDERSNTQKETLGLSTELVAELQEAEHIVISVPIYNFGIPAALKAWIDLIARAQLTFYFNDEGQPIGLLNNKKVIIVMASGGTPLGSDWDTATPYMKQVLGFVGMTDVTFINANEMTTDDQVSELLNKQKNQSKGS